MTYAAVIKYENDCLRIAGDLNFLTVPKLSAQSSVLLEQCRQLHFDLKKIHSSNSAALALIIEWIQYAKRTNKPISFSNVPAQLVAIAAAVGIEGFFSAA